ncbi:unnamed protein product [Staurois parvus]|uniref:Uncharacterized protein n=1 Tax=Staurois parvus TaxID=386267 RepID=A0ABN9FIM7_9NEOB|nr:unnamed protein product [Staurois parvus]
MKCPWYLFHRLFLVWARTQGPHDPLFSRGPTISSGPHEMPLVLFHRLF